MRALVVLAVLATACTAAAADGLRARVSPAPATLAVRTWTPTIALTRKGKPATAALVLRIRKGSARRSFPARPVRRGSYRARVVFPADGRWAWTVASGRAVLARGAVTVAVSERFDLPYDIALAPGGEIFLVDRGRVLRWDGRRVRVHSRMPTDELTGLARVADGTLYATDLAGGRIFRIDPAGKASVAARMAAPSDVVTDGTTLWVTSLEGGLYRVNPATGAVSLLAPIGRSHGLDRDAAGNLYVQDDSRTARVDPVTGATRVVSPISLFRIVAAPDGSLYGAIGDPNGGRVLHIAADGSATPVVGTGKLSPQADGRALDVGILPSAIALAPDGSLLVTQTQPVPAIRRVDLAAGTITTLVRGR